MVYHEQGDQAAHSDLNDPEQFGVYAAVQQYKTFHTVVFGSVQVAQMIDGDEVQYSGYENAQ